jgi:hypothetical protein
MVDVREAVKRAVAFAEELLEPNRTGQLLIEEVELVTVRGKQVWKITLSVPWTLSDSLSDSRPSPHRKRDYKTFTVDRKSGEVVSMKIRELAHAE